MVNLHVGQVLDRSSCAAISPKPHPSPVSPNLPLRWQPTEGSISLTMVTLTSEVTTFTTALATRGKCDDPSPFPGLPFRSTSACFWTANLGGFSKLSLQIKFSRNICFSATGSKSLVQMTPRGDTFARTSD